MNQKKERSINQLRWIGNAEGISFLVLLFISMPHKYLFDYPIAVKLNGWLHGLLFIIYIAAVLRAAYFVKWNFLRVGIALAASLIPFATFILDKRLGKNPMLY